LDEAGVLPVGPAGVTIKGMGRPVEAHPLLTAAWLAETPDDMFQRELDEGELILMAPAGGEHGLSEMHLAGLIFAEVKKRKLGVMFSSDTGFLLKRNPDTVRCPDIAFVRKERLPLSYAKEGGYVVGAPDLAVEIQSPSQSPADLEKKVRQYLEAGGHTVWVIHLRRREARIYRRSGEIEKIDAAGFLEAPEILPGVRIALRDIFETA
jgi:Uma2 family endonuclease